MLLATYVIDYLGRVSIKTPLKSMAISRLTVVSRAAKESRFTRAQS